MYFYVLTVGQFTDVKRMVLVREGSAARRQRRLARDFSSPNGNLQHQVQDKYVYPMFLRA